MERLKALKKIEMAFKESSVVLLLGPKQVGKTTTAKAYLSKSKMEGRYFDLHHPLEKSVLQTIDKGLFVLDGIESRTDLLDDIEQLAGPKRKFLLVGNRGQLVEQCPFAAAVELSPLSSSEISDSKLLWLKGGFPKSFAAYSDEESFLWRQNLLTALPHRRLLQMLAHCHGQLLNATQLARSLEVSDHTIRRHIDELDDHFITRRLNPWVENIPKRQAKSPKIFFRDSGLVHTLLGIKSAKELETYPKLASFWECYALEEVIRKRGALPNEVFFWATQGGASLDLLIIKEGHREGFVFHYGDKPKTTPSLEIASTDLKLNHLYLVIPGKFSASISENITLKGLDNF